MTARTQHLRLTTTNTTPASTSRPTGELWVNYPDQRIGFIDSTKTARDLLAVRRHAATATYATGDFVFQAGQLYRAKTSLAPKAFTASDWDQVQTAALADTRYLPLTGGTLTGMLTLPATVPTLATHAATKSYVDGQIATAGNGRFLPLTGGTLSGPLSVLGTFASQGITTTTIAANSLTATGNIASNAALSGVTLSVTGAATIGGALSAPSLAVAGFASMGSGGVSGAFGVGGLLTAGALNVTGATTVQAINAASLTATGNIVTPTGVLSGHSLTIGTTASVGSLSVSGAITAVSANIATLTTSALAVSSLTVSPGALAANVLSATNVTCTNLTASGGIAGNYVQSGSSFLGASLHLTGSAQIDGDTAVNGQIAFGANYDSNLRLTSDATLTMWQVSSSGARWQYNRASANMGFIGTSGTPLVQITDSQFVSAHAASYKPGGGAWLDSSDSRIKTVLGPYEAGLPELLKLNPVRYTFKRNVTMNGYAMHQFENGRVRAGLVAQDVEAVWPELVTQVPGFIDNEPVNDLRILDPSELNFAVLNALRELNERVTNLEENA